MAGKTAFRVVASLFAMLAFAAHSWGRADLDERERRERAPLRTPLTIGAALLAIVGWLVSFLIGG